MLEIAFRPRAQLDLESIYLHLAMVASSKRVADSTLETIYASVERLAEFPELGSAFEDEDLDRPYRRMLSGSYWIYYTYNTSTLTIWRIFHTRQDIDDFTLIDW